MAAVVPALKIGAKLGAGHFGEVFEGVDSVHGRVAVKVMRRKPGQKEAEWRAYKNGFLSEAQNLSKARHSNVVEVYHIQELPDGQSIRFCMALCPGGSLQSAYEKGPLPLKDVRKIGTEIALGLEALHHRGMLHRDIKPGNILLNAQGISQLGDFGLVTDNLVLGYGSQAGYADHIAYEVWGGKGTSVKSDVWAFGMTLYRLLHGQLWYDQSPAPRHLVKHGGFVERLDWLPHIPKRWRRVIRKMITDDTNHRYQNAEQVLSALSQLPTSPWHITVAADSVRWTQTSVSRRKTVLWTWQAPNKHEWTAWSEPVGGSGRSRTLGGSGNYAVRKEVMKQLTHFLAE